MFSVDSVWFGRLLSRHCPISVTCLLTSADGEVLLSSSPICPMPLAVKNLTSLPENSLHAFRNFSNIVVTVSEPNHTGKCRPPIFESIKHDSNSPTHFCAEEECATKNLSHCTMFQSCSFCGDSCRSLPACRLMRQASKNNASEAAIIVCVIIFLILFLMAVVSCRRRSGDEEEQLTTPRESYSIEEELSDGTDNLPDNFLRETNPKMRLEKNGYTESSGYSSMTQTENTQNTQKKKPKSSKCAGRLIRTQVQVHRASFRELESLI